ncbi:MAG: YhbY family RNA-binding protein [Clostridium sp.]|nr:YhbY family RNA-binding protein [Clostridium sp.]
MINSKQRSYLRSLSSRMQPIFQIGKNDIGDELYNQISDALEARELIKISVLDTSTLNSREACNIICSELNCEGVQVIGRKFVIYKKSERHPKIELQ